MASGATCVQRLDGSRDSAIHTKYRISLRSSSMREPRYPLPRVVLTYLKMTTPPAHTVSGATRTRSLVQVPWRNSRRCSFAGFDNDPSAGSPTETLLRLLLPLNDKVRWTSRDVVGSEPPTSPRSEHFTGPFNRINQVAFLSDVGSVRDKRTCGSSARRGHDSRTCRVKTLPIGRSEARRPHARSMLRIRDHKQKLVDLHNLTTSRGLIGTQALLRRPPAAREGQEEERDNERHHSLTIGSQNRNPLTRTSQS
ncbi:unnamed protein product [Prunus brigantina]